MSIHGPDEPVYTIGVMARLVGVSPQTLRAWEREALISPHRTDTNNRLYSENDFHLLSRIRDLAGQGINPAGIRAILGGASTEAGPKARVTTYGESSRD
ncbi:MerR family transcriptional regulator [Sulfobacillus harzensis]|nr:MerR family transcriptional regulator [Sulfobacillus harzensis]